MLSNVGPQVGEPRVVYQDSYQHCKGRNANGDNRLYRLSVVHHGAR
jgi:hypothetical protein